MAGYGQIFAGSTTENFWTPMLASQPKSSSQAKGPRCIYMHVCMNFHQSLLPKRISDRFTEKFWRQQVQKLVKYISDINI